MSRQRVFLIARILSIVIFSGTVICAAQDTTASSKPAHSEANDSKPKPPIQAYHLEFSINELEGGRKVNSRQYSTDLVTNEGNEIQIGTRVPVPSKDNGVSYLDVGTNIFARISEIRDQVELSVRAEFSNFAITDADVAKLEQHPVIRQLKIAGAILLPLEGPFVIGSVDDPNSKRQFQLEVTVSKVR